ncbi:hypothetical protein IKE67_04985 [bacterium]|nr:hypothetical protein [bacterium]
MIKKGYYRQNIGMLMACVSLLVFGGCALFQNGGITYTSITASGIKILPAVFIMYILGWATGWIIESSQTVKKANLGYANSLLEEILKEEGLGNLDDSDFEENEETAAVEKEIALEDNELELESKE